MFLLRADGKTINHIAPYIDKYSYKFCCGLTVGAAIGFTKQQFEDLNGFSNEYAVRKDIVEPHIEMARMDDERVEYGFS